MTTFETAFARHLNPRVIYDQLLDHESLTRDELSKLTGLTRVAASASVKHLVGRGLALPVETAAGEGGPAARRYALTPTAGYVVAAHITHGNVTMAAADLTGTLAAKLELPFEDPDDAASMLHRAVVGCLDMAGADIGRLRRVVLGSPGVIDPRTGEFAFATLLPNWQHTITAELRRSLDRPVVFENDVNLAAMAEARFGHGQGVRHLAFALLSDGIGLGLVLNGRLHRGRHGWAGEIGFLPAPMPNPHVEVAGMQKSTHQLASTPAIAALSAAAGFGSDPAIAVTMASAALAAHKPQDAGAEAFLDEVARRVALVVSHACLLVDPEVLVLDGSYLVAGGDALLDRICLAVARISPTPVRLTLAEVHDEPILRGALQTALEDARETLFAG
ncbi:MAG: ROK family protein [Acidothermaceae bacterium]